MVANLGLGTVQFGMRYGISNEHGQPQETEIAAILESAKNLEIGYLDTAFAYPNSETLIGRYLPADTQFRIITKTIPLDGPQILRESKAKILDAVAISMDRMRVGHLHGLLLHHGSDLGKEGWEYLLEALTEAQARGWVSAIGASVYNENELKLVESRFIPGIIQAPFNVLDTRLLASSCFKRLKTAGTEFHARSVFLQGLLLMSPSKLPEFFVPLKPTLVSLRDEWAKEGLDPLTACLGYVMGHPDIDAAIVGVNSLAELQQIHQAASRSASRKTLIDGLVHAVEAKYLDPSRWPFFTH